MNCYRYYVGRAKQKSHDFFVIYLQNKIILPKLEAVVCEFYGLLFTWSPLGHYLRELLVKKWYKAHIILRLNFYGNVCVRTEHSKLLFQIIKFESGSI